jgi:hypothetical protein
MAISMDTNTTWATMPPSASATALVAMRLSIAAFRVPPPGSPAAEHYAGGVALHDYVVGDATRNDGVRRNDDAVADRRTIHDDHARAELYVRADPDTLRFLALEPQWPGDIAVTVIVAEDRAAGSDQAIVTDLDTADV